MYFEIEKAPPKPTVKDWFDIVQSTFTVVAIIAAGIWFYQQRSDKPLVKIEQTATQRRLSGADDMWLVAIEVRATNTGKVKVELGEGVLEVSQLNPLPGTQLIKTTLKNLTLEPGESDQAIFRIYRVPDYIKTVQIRSTYRVPKTNGLSWNLLSIVDIGAAPPAVKPAIQAN